MAILTIETLKAETLKILNYPKLLTTHTMAKTEKRENESEATKRLTARDLESVIRSIQKLTRQSTIPNETIHGVKHGLCKQT
jgi:hypothetical protein